MYIWNKVHIHGLIHNLHISNPSKKNTLRSSVKKICAENPMKNWIHVCQIFLIILSNNIDVDIFIIKIFILWQLIVKK